MSNTEKSATPEIKAEAPKEKWWARLIDDCRRRFQQYHSIRQDENPQDRAARRSAAATVWIACFTVATVLVGVFTYFAVDGQLKVMQGQLDEMRSSGAQTDQLIRANAQTADAAKAAAEVAQATLVASQRAWIRIDEIEFGGGALSFDENGASVGISFNITNVGNSPAIKLTPHARLVVLKSGGPFPWQEQQTLCGEVRKAPLSEGFALFPGESFPQNIGVAKWSLGTNVSQEQIKAGRAVSIDGKHVALSVVGCIDYTFPTDIAKHHETGFIFDIQRKGGGLISPESGVIPIGELMMLSSSIGLGRHAD